MDIPNAAIVPLYIASFILLYVQYFRLNPDRRLLNVRFGLMAGAVVLMFASVLLADWSLSLIFFILALVWVGMAIYLFRQMPPREH
jgi:hypothetical protein